MHLIYKLFFIFYTLILALAPYKASAQPDKPALIPVNSLITHQPPTNYHVIDEWKLITSEMNLDKPTDVAIDSQGFIYVADTAKRAILKFDPQGNLVSTWFGPNKKRLAHPARLAIDLNVLYIADRYEAIIHRYRLDGTYLGSLGERGDEVGKISEVMGLCVDPLGQIFVADHNRDKILRYDSEGHFLSEFGEKGDKKGQIFGITDISCDEDGNIWVIDFNDRIQKFTNHGKFIMAWGKQGDEIGNFNDPEGLAIDRNGVVYIADTQNGRIQRLSLANTELTHTILPDIAWGNNNKQRGALRKPTGIAINKNGVVIIADPQLGKISFWKIPNDVPVLQPK